MECTCTIAWFGNPVKPVIHKCSLCETAPALLQFAEDIADEVDTHGFILHPDVFVREIKLLIAKAKGETK